MTDADAPRAGRMQLGRGAARLMQDLEEQYPGAAIESFVVLVNFQEGGEGFTRWYTWPGDAGQTDRMQRAALYVVQQWMEEE